MLILLQAAPTMPWWASLLLGPVGLTAGLLVYAYATYKGWSVPGPTHEKAEERAEKAEAESERYAEQLRAERGAVANLRVSNARLEEALAAARRDLRRMESKQDRNTRMLEDLHDDYYPPGESSPDEREGV